MSDILVDLCTAYQTSLDSYMVSGQDLDWLRFAGMPGEVDLTSLYGLLPCLIYFWVETPMVADQMDGPCRSDKKNYIFEMNCIFEMHDVSYGTASPVVPKVKDHIEDAAYLETIYNRNKLGLSQDCVMTRMWSGQPTFPGYTIEGFGWMYSINLRFDHLWQDRRYT